MRKKEIIDLANKLGGDRTLNQIIEEYKLPFECPQCKGQGIYSKETIKRYPSGLPDSGWVPDEIVYVSTECELCNGHGWTGTEYKPKLVQDGWEVS
ncbi:hypothetical protein [Vagococcus fluvialis]|uniref:hypothetical protein n=1 Tax=Vagococcus fluvialis TaxID=2738 RepID=UPI001A8EF691|nr:hypothetical protein [Vagococcus fluvialis]MBO0486311.1 hypothetical protein [Vagococcus fluvialis]